ncbi:MAG: hypothetical protein RL557_1016, partial [archaeon]
MKKRNNQNHTHGARFENQSPWLEQLQTLRRPRDVLSSNEETDVVIVGGGIAGISTAYFILRNTTKNVILLEAHKIAHGATGHNAGQIASYFEKPFSKITEEYGLAMAARGQKEILMAWDLLEEVYRRTKLKAHFSHFIGYAGCSTFEQLITHLENKRLRHTAGIQFETILVSEEAPFLDEIPAVYKKLYAFVPHRTIMKLLETKDRQYYAALGSKKGCLNSALFCEELLGFLLYTYKTRIKLFEFSPVDIIKLYKHAAIVYTKQNYKVTASKVILCTNGFENLFISNKSGKAIDGSFHDAVFGVIGYMAAYLDKKLLKPNAISYFPSAYISEADPYFYLTKRKYDRQARVSTLVSVGGPEVKLEDTKEYIRDRPYFEKWQQEIDWFLKKTYAAAPKLISYKYHWHGLMGYTKTELRCIGPHPYNKNLLYNLGCNGVG